MANLGNYQAAIDLFSQAINLDAKDFRFVCCPCSLFYYTSITSLASTKLLGRRGDGNLLAIDSSFWESDFQNIE